MKITCRLTDEELDRLNRSYDWMEGQIDSAGRTIGGREWLHAPDWQDERVRDFADRFGPLAGKTIIEPGCFEGVLTSQLCALAARVTAFDARPTCVAKSRARCSALDISPTILLTAAEQITRLGPADAIFHAGLLYHLPRPVDHLRQLARLTTALALHTHCAAAADDQNEGYLGTWREETGPKPEREGIDRYAFWLTRAELLAAAHDQNWQTETVWERPDHDNKWDCFYFLTRDSILP